MYFLCVLCAFVVKNAFAFAFSADCSRVSAATTPKWHSGGITGGIRCTCAISAESAELSAAQISQFSGLLPHPRQSFRRMYCKICTNCEICECCAKPTANR